MNVETRVADAGAKNALGNSDLFRLGLEGFDPFVDKVNLLRKTLTDLEGMGDRTIAKGALRIKDELAAIEPTVTMIGQVKAGKTSLVNAMIGWPDLLPADVNPWTSVVTSLHINTPGRAEETSASFRFFDQNEWDRLVEFGGRIGELASRAGADDELDKVREQIEIMREKSRARLGKRFEMLLGQAHDYGHFDQDLIERYVCLGDDFEDDDGSSDTQGRFADITKSADLYLDRPDLPMPLCIRDTPGVNDTFMMREQITIRAIRDSRICVVVLSAHQALSSTDMALIRLISNVKSREVVIFVNRIDELVDPAAQVAEIRESIIATLDKHDGPKDAQIIFGSAYWAGKAMSGDIEGLSEDSAAALMTWAEAELSGRPDVETPAQMIWELSGVPVLYRALAERINESVGEEALGQIARSAKNLANGLRASNNVVRLHHRDSDAPIIDRRALDAELSTVASRALTALEEAHLAELAVFNTRLDRSHKSFLERATASLVAHLEKWGEQSVWSYNPTGLRLLLRSAYQVFGAKSQSSAQSVLDATASEIAALYESALQVSAEGFKIEAPQAPKAPPPVALGQTIALDMNGSWWKNWWFRRRGYKAFASGFYDLIKAETAPIVDDLRITQAGRIQAETRGVLEAFLAEQRAILTGIAEQTTVSDDDLSALFGVTASADRDAAIASALSALDRFAA